MTTHKLQAVYITFPSLEEAKKVVAVLLNEKLIACANMIPSQSMYFWQGEIESEEEVVAILKTTTTHIKSIRSRVQELHSYDVPCITNWAIAAAPSYLDWISSTVKPMQ